MIKVSIVSSRPQRELPSTPLLTNTPRTPKGKKNIKRRQSQPRLVHHESRLAQLAPLLAAEPAHDAGLLLLTAPREIGVLGLVEGQVKEHWLARDSFDGRRELDEFGRLV